MKYLYIFILVLFPFISFSQIYDIKANIQYVDGNIKICLEDTRVVWGFHKDTLGFNFNNRDIHYLKLSLKDKRKHNRIVRLSENIHNDSQNLYFLRKDKHNELYFIRILVDNEGMFIYVSNVKYGMPSFIITNRKICNEKNP